LLPIFNEYIKFLKDKDINIDIVEGYYWLDRQIIKAYDKQGTLQKIARLSIDDNLEITYKKYKNNYERRDLLSWQETIQLKSERLRRLEIDSIELIKNTINEQRYNNYQSAVLYSGGKDSTVTKYLVENIIKTEIIFSNTSLDCADTYKHIKQIKDIQIINPDEGFYKWIYKNIIPTRFSRGCCTYFKEGSMIQKLDANEKYLFFMGMRNEESAQRSNYTDQWKNEKWGDRVWQGILPIRTWTEEDIWLYIFWKGLDFNTKYRKGYARVGCAIACPFYTKSTWVLDKYWYPKAYNRWHNILEKDFVDNAKWTRLNCTTKEYHMCWNGGLLRPEPTEEVIQELADHKGIEIKVAEKYFNHICKVCGKKVNKNNEIAMNLKLLGRNIADYFCKKHLMEFLEIDKDQWNTYVKDFKMQGCDLF
jgi:phosphoadenosine phosphosulfate reductase